MLWLYFYILLCFVERLRSQIIFNACTWSWDRHRTYCTVYSPYGECTIYGIANYFRSKRFCKTLYSSRLGDSEDCDSKLTGRLAFFVSPQWNSVQGIKSVKIEGNVFVDLVIASWINARLKCSITMEYERAFTGHNPSHLIFVVL